MAACSRCYHFNLSWLLLHLASEQVVAFIGFVQSHEPRFLRSVEV